jgi:RimJ/RimL family protein N-acetyltransferase
VLRAAVDRDNVASLRCFAACGFTPDDDDDGSPSYAQLVHRAAA